MERRKWSLRTLLSKSLALVGSTLKTGGVFDGIRQIYRIRKRRGDFDGINGIFLNLR